MIWMDGAIKVAGVIGPYPARVSTRRVNGWPLAKIDRATLVRLAADLRELDEDGVPELEFDGTVLVLRDSDGQAGSSSEADAEGYFPAPRWTWQVVAEPWPERAEVIARAGADPVAALLAAALLGLYTPPVLPAPVELFAVLDAVRAQASHAFEMRLVQLGVPAGHVLAVAHELWRPLAEHDPQPAAARPTPAPRAAAADPLLGQVAATLATVPDSVPQALESTFYPVVDLLVNALYQTVDRHGLSGPQANAMVTALLGGLCRTPAPSGQARVAAAWLPRSIERGEESHAGE